MLGFSESALIAHDLAQPDPAEHKISVRNMFGQLEASLASDPQENNPQRADLLVCVAILWKIACEVERPFTHVLVGDEKLLIADWSTKCSQYAKLGEKIIHKRAEQRVQCENKYRKRIARLQQEIRELEALISVK